MFDLATLVSLTAGSLMTGIAGWKSYRAFSDARLLVEIGSTPLSEVSEGLHEVRGTVKAEATFTAPISERLCSGWRLLVEQQRRSAWEVVYDTRKTAPFVMDDGTGTLTVDPATAVLVLSKPSRVRSGVMSVPSPEWDALKALLGDPAIEPTTPFLRWKEESIEPDDVLTVIVTLAKPESGEGWTVSPDNVLISDRDDAEVVKQQRVQGQRQALWALGGIAVLTYGVWSLISAL